MKESTKAAKARYRKNKVWKLYLDFYPGTDIDIIRWLEAQPNKAGAVKRACHLLMEKESAPVDMVPDTSAPVDMVPDTSAPVDTVPDTSAPVDTVEPESAPVDTDADTSAPVDTVPDTSAPVDVKPDYTRVWTPDGYNDPEGLLQQCYACKHWNSFRGECEWNEDEWEGGFPCEGGKRRETPVDTDADTSAPVDTVEPESAPDLNEIMCDDPGTLYEVVYITKKGGQKYHSMDIFAHNAKEAVANFKAIYSGRYGHAFHIKARKPYTPEPAGSFYPETSEIPAINKLPIIDGDHFLTADYALNELKKDAIRKAAKQGFKTATVRAGNKVWRYSTESGELIEAGYNPMKQNK